MAKNQSNNSIAPKLSPHEAIPLLKRQLERLKEIAALPKDDPRIPAWENTTTNLLDDTFGRPNGNKHANTSQFANADGGLPLRKIPFGHRPNPNAVQHRYILKQQKRAELLKAYIEQLEDQCTLVVPKALVLPPECGTRFGNKVFIGHGHSLTWRELKDFLQDRLGLEWDEFNRESSAGLSTKERLRTMLDNAGFAFLVLTAEDEHPDGSFHPRENVIHEAGLFQGKLGFERAIILKEQGCAEFSNIHGLTQIPFPKGNISAAFEEIRKVLEREGMIGSQNR